MRTLVLLALGSLLATAPAFAQESAEPGTGTAWTFEPSLFTYFVPDDEDYVQPTLEADRGALHLEGRFNYEDLETGSAWVGMNFSAGDRFALELTPMAGVVFGNTTGLAPGYKVSLSWRALELYSESEFVFDLSESSDSFLYTWSELAVIPVDWGRFGLVVQRTKAYQTEFDIQRGFFGGFTYRRADVAAYVLNPDASRPTVVLAVAARF